MNTAEEAATVGKTLQMNFEATALPTLPDGSGKWPSEEVDDIEDQVENGEVKKQNRSAEESKADMLV